MQVNRNTFGQIFFALAILIFIFMLTSPLTQLVANVQEYFTLTLLNFPVSEILHISAGDTNPPLYYLLLKALSKITTDFAVLKVFSTLPVALILILATTKIRSDYGWLTAGMFALALTCEFFTSYVILRPYSWAMLFTLLSFVFLKDILNGDSTVSLILFTLFSALASYTHYYSLVTSVVLYIILLYQRRSKSTLISAAVFVISYLPQIPTLINLLSSMNPLGEMSPDILIQNLAQFAYSADTFLSVVTLLVLAIIAILYLKNNKEEKTYVMAGITAYFATFIAILIVSLIKPVFVIPGLMPAGAVLWLSVAIMAGKIRPERQVFIAVALITMLFITGFASGIVSADSMTQSGNAQADALEKIAQADNSTVIITSPGLVMYFADMSDIADIYCFNMSYVYGENMNYLHEIFDFKNINEEDLANFTSENSNRDIYLVSWGNPDTDLDTEKVLKEQGIVISKVKPQTEEEYYQLY